MAWHLGYPLSQTIFSCVYIDALTESAPKTVEEADFRSKAGDDSHENTILGTLRAYCLGLLKTCRLVNERIKREHYYEVAPSSWPLRIVAF